MPFVSTLHTGTHSLGSQPRLSPLKSASTLLGWGYSSVVQSSSSMHQGPGFKSQHQANRQNKTAATKTKTQKNKKKETDSLDKMPYISFSPKRRLQVPVLPPCCPLTVTSSHCPTIHHFNHFFVQIALSFCLLPLSSETSPGDPSHMSPPS